MKNKIIISIFSILILSLIILIALYFNYPRISYSYDEATDSYYVNTVYGNSKEYIIKEEIEGKPVTSIGERAFQYKNKLERIVLPSSIEKIDKLAFSDCSSLESINLENVIFIERNAFSYCTNLNNITIGGYIGGSAFYKCTSLENITLNTNLISLGTYSFSYTIIKSLLIPNNTKFIYTDAFKYMDKLEEISIPAKLDNTYLNTLNVRIIWR